MLEGQLIPTFLYFRKSHSVLKDRKQERFLNYSLEQTYSPNCQLGFKGCHWLCIRTIPHWNQSVGPKTKWNAIMGLSLLDGLTLWLSSLYEKVKKDKKDDIKVCCVWKESLHLWPSSAKGKILLPFLSWSWDIYKSTALNKFMVIYPVLQHSQLGRAVFHF